MATGPIETHLHHSFNWENAAPGARIGPRGRSVNCGSVPSAQCVRLGSEINRIEIHEPDSLEEYSGQFKLRIPRSLHRTLAEHSKQEGISMNQYCAYLLSRNDALYSKQAS